MWKPCAPAARPAMRPVTFRPVPARAKVRIPSTLPSLAGCSTATARVTGPAVALAAGEGAADGAGEGAPPICAAAPAARSDDARTTNEALFMMLLQEKRLWPL